MRRLLTLLLLLSPACFGYASYSGWCEQGGKTVTVQGIPSTTLVQQSYPNLSGSGSGPNVTVYLTGTSNKATIYSDNAGTALGNPFPCTATGQYQFFAGEQVVDLTFAGSGVSSYTISKVPLSEPLGVVSDVGCAPLSLSACSARAVSLGQSLTCSLNWLSQNSETLSASIQAFQGCLIQPSSGQTVTLTNCPQAGASQIADFSLGGIVVLPSGCASRLEWGGVDLSGVTDSHVGVNGIMASGSGNISVGAGLINMGTTAMSSISVASIHSVNFVGTTFLWDQGFTGTAVTITGGDAGNSQQAYFNVGTIKKATQNWAGGSDTTSIGVLLQDVSSIPYLAAHVEFFANGMRLTNSAADTVQNNIYFAGDDNKVGLEFKPNGGFGVNNQTVTGYVHIDGGSTFCPASTPVAGTYYIKLDSGSDNANLFINMDLEGGCVVKNIDILSAANTFIQPRLEAALTGGVTLESGTFSNMIYSPFLDSGKWAPVIVDNGLNTLFGAIGWQADTQGNALPWVKISENGTLVWQIGTDGTFFNPKGTIGASSPNAPTNGLGVQGGIAIGTAAGTPATGGLTAIGAIKTSSTASGQQFLCLGTPAISSGFGTSPSLGTGANDCSFTVTVGTGSTIASGQITFGNAAPNTYTCGISSEAANGHLVQGVAASATANFFPLSSMYFAAGAVFQVNCSAH